MSRAEKKRRRQKARKRIVMLQRLFAACLILAVLGVGGYFVWNIPSIQLNLKLGAGKEYTQEAAYEEAIEAYESALEIDSTSVEAYRCMAGAYLDIEDESHAKQILLDGWNNTQDESLHQYYCTVILNEAVEELEFTDNKTGKKQTVKDAECGVFVYAGTVPNTQMYTELRLDGGYIPVDGSMQTEIPGVFAAGDICVKKVRQVATAVSDGAIAGIQAAAIC